MTANWILNLLLKYFIPGTKALKAAHERMHILVREKLLEWAQVFWKGTPDIEFILHIDYFFLTLLQCIWISLQISDSIQGFNVSWSSKQIWNIEQRGSMYKLLSPWYFPPTKIKTNTNWSNTQAVTQQTACDHIPIEAMKRYIALSLLISSFRPSVSLSTNSRLGNFARLAICTQINMKILWNHWNP